MWREKDIKQTIECSLLTYLLTSLLIYLLPYLLTLWSLAEALDPTRMFP